jgi:hypothetical protein
LLSSGYSRLRSDFSDLGIHHSRMSLRAAVLRLHPKKVQMYCICLAVCFQGMPNGILIGTVRLYDQRCGLTVWRVGSKGVMLLH